MMYRKKNKRKEETVVEEQTLETPVQVQDASNIVQTTVIGSEAFSTPSEGQVSEQPQVVESSAEHTASEESIVESELIDDAKIKGLETSIAISKDLMDEKGIDVVKVEQENKVIEDGKIEIKTTISTKNYDEAVVKLINEVKIFSDEDADLGIVQKRRVWPIILTIFILLGIAGGLYYYFCVYEKPVVKKQENKEEKGDSKSYKYEETEEGIIFYNGNDEIDKYECENCKAYSLGTYEYFSTNPTVLAIHQNEEIFLYDYTSKQVVSDKYKQLKNLKQNDKTVAFIVTNDEDLSGIIDIQGKLLVPLEYESLGFSTSAGEVTDYSYSKNFITAKKEGLWGAINFEGEEVLPFEYEDIYYNGYDSISVCIEGLWYLNDLNNNKLITTGYDIIIPIKSYVFASVNNVFYVLNYKGETIINKEIPTYLNTFRSRENSVIPAFKIIEEGTVVKIYIMDEEENYEEYKFNTVNGELTEIIQ